MRCPSGGSKIIKKTLHDSDIKGFLYLDVLLQQLRTPTAGPLTATLIPPSLALETGFFPLKWYWHSLLSKSLTCQALHPVSFINPQVVIDDFQDVSQQCVHMGGSERGAAALPSLRVVLGAVLPPARHVAAQHRQHHLHDVGHLDVTHARLRQLFDLLQGFLQGWNERTHLLDLSRHPKT